MLQRIVRAIGDWRATSRTIEQLSDLSDEQLKDIGILRGEIPDVARSRRVVFH